MNLKEGYFGNFKNYPKGETLIAVSRYYPRFLGKSIRWRPELAPSKKLLADYKEGSLPWEEYEKRFRKEMESGPAQHAINEIITYSQYSLFRLLCYEKKPPCHRFILIDIINEQKNKTCEEPQ